MAVTTLRLAKLTASNLIQGGRFDRPPHYPFRIMKKFLLLALVLLAAAACGTARTSVTPKPSSLPASVSVTPAYTVPKICSDFAAMDGTVLKDILESTGLPYRDVFVADLAQWGQAANSIGVNATGNLISDLGNTQSDVGNSNSLAASGVSAPGLVGNVSNDFAAVVNDCKLLGAK